jgi:hypothetical protein
MPLYDPRAFRDQPGSPILLNQGIDGTTTPILTSPGSLSQAINVELVDDVLSTIQGALEFGTIPLNSLPDEYYILYGDSTSDFTINNSPNDYDVAYWYKDDLPTNTDKRFIGTGIIREIAITGQPANFGTAFVLFNIEGESPKDHDEIWAVISGLQTCISINPASTGFVLPSRFETSLNAGIVRRLNIETYLDEQSSATWDAIRPKPLGTGAISHLFQLEDVTYAVRDFLVGKFNAGEEEPSIGDKIQLDATTGVDPIYYVARADITNNNWEGGFASGWLYLYPASDSTLVDSDIDKWNAQHQRTITNLTTGNTLGTTPQQTSPVTVVNAREHGLLWKLDTDARVNTGWKYVDMGYSINFDAGQIAPLAAEAPLILTDSISAFQDTGFIPFSTPASEYPSTGTYSAWTGLGNLTTDNGVTCDTTIATSDFSRVIELQVDPDEIPGDSQIIGIEVEFEASQTVGADVYIEKVELRDFYQQSNYLLSSNRAEAEFLTTSPTVYTFGGQQDLFGLTELLQEGINGQDFTVLLQFGNSNGASTRIVQVDYVNIKIHYIQKGQDVYINDGSSDVATGTLYAYQVHDGDWSTDDATGWMTLHDVTTPSAVFAGMQIRTKASGAGDVIADVLALEKNILPSYDDMTARRARCKNIVSSIGGGEENIKAFVVNGVSPSFAVDTDDKFQFIRTPVDPAKDRPRYVGEQIEHLVLGLKEHIMVSSIGASNNFSTYDGATSWSIGDTITGLVSAPDNTLIILAQDSIRRLSGSGATGQDAFSVSTHSTKGGAKHYSGVYVGEPVFFDDFGISTLQVTQKFGDFDQGKMNYGVEDWLRDRLTNHTTDADFGYRMLLETVAVNGKNQVRAYFNDGWVLTASWPGPRTENTLPKFTTQNYSWDTTAPNIAGVGFTPTFNDEFKATALSSYITSWGEERLLMGLADGRVALLDQGVSFLADDMYGGFMINPLKGSNPIDDSIYTTGMTLSVEKDYMMHLTIDVGIDYDPPPWNRTDDWGTGNSDTIDTDVYQNRYLNGTVEVFMNNISSATAWSVYFQHPNGEFVRPIKFIGISPKLRSRGQRKARVQKSVVENS